MNSDSGSGESRFEGKKLYFLVLQAVSFLGWKIRHKEDGVFIEAPEGTFRLDRENPSLHLGHPLVVSVFEHLLEGGFVLIVRESGEKSKDVNPPDYSFVNLELLSRKREIKYLPFYKFTFLVEFISQERKSAVYELFLDPSGEELPAKVRDFMRSLDPVALPEGYEVVPGPVPVSLKHAYEKSKITLKNLLLQELPELEKLSRESLLKELERISSFYTRQMAEAGYIEDMDRIEEEFNLKVEELKETHRILVRVRLVGVLVMLSYSLRWTYYFSKPGPSPADEPSSESVPSFRISWNPWLGWDLPLCDVCHKPVDKGDVLYCETGAHFVHSGCGDVCFVCGKGECYLHGMDRCAVCGKPVCSDCQSRCSVCGRALCPEHTERCAECGRPLCPEHAKKCRICGKTYCPEHIYTCPFCEENVCKNCGIECAQCGAVSCPEHSGECAYCGRTFCADHIHPVFSLQGSFTGLACKDHSLKCDVCGRYYPISAMVRCDAGSVPHMVCKNCYDEEKKACSLHLLKCPVCGKEFIEKEGVLSDSGYFVCKDCAVEDFYGQLRAPDDVFKCEICGRVLPKEKMSEHRGVCRTCASAQKSRVSLVEARLLQIPPISCLRGVDGDYVVLVLESVGKVIIYNRKTFKKV